MERQENYTLLLRRAEEAFAAEDYDSAESLFLQADQAAPEEAAAAFYGAVAGALRDGAEYRSIAALAGPAERLFFRAAERFGSGEGYFSACRKALSAVVDVTSRHYDAVTAYVKKERKKNRRHPEAAEAAEGVFRDCVSLIGETAKKTVAAALERAQDMAAADDFFWDSAMILLDNAEAYRISAELGRDGEITELFGEIDRLRGNISGEFSGEELEELELDAGEYAELVCPSCGETLSFPADEQTGTVECPFCGNRFAL